MQYEARRRMTLAGVEHEPGMMIAPSIVEQINPSRLASLIRVGHFRMRPDVSETQLAVALGVVPEEEVEVAVEVAATEDADNADAPDDTCPHCGKGPFKRLAGHISKTHPDV